MYTESRLALSAMRIASFLYLWLSAKVCVQLNLKSQEVIQSAILPL